MPEKPSKEQFYLDSFYKTIEEIADMLRDLSHQHSEQCVRVMLGMHEYDDRQSAIDEARFHAVMSAGIENVFDEIIRPIIKYRSLEDEYNNIGVTSSYDVDE